jgi:hypothetical protein
MQFVELASLDDVPYQMVVNVAIVGDSRKWRGHAAAVLVEQFDVGLPG